MKNIFTLILCFSAVLASAQTNVKFKINHYLAGQAFQLEQESTNNLDHKFELDRLEYYISSISIVHDTGKVTPATDVYLLVNASQSQTFDLGSYDVENIEAIKFSVGVNTPENHQDPTKWPQDHPLYPKAPSMHWGWAAGYRFVALEGSSGDQLNKMFQIHALGNNNYHKISIPAEGQDDNGDLLIEIKADYVKAIENISISAGVVTHGDYGEAADLMRNFRDYVFTSMEGEENTLSVASAVKPQLNVFPNPSKGQVTFSSESSAMIEGYTISNALGAVVQEQSISPSLSCVATIEEKGIYFVELKLAGDQRVVKKLLIH